MEDPTLGTPDTASNELGVDCDFDFDVDLDLNASVRHEPMDEN